MLIVVFKEEKGSHIGYYVSSNLNALSYNEIKESDVPYIVFENDTPNINHFSLENEQYSLFLPNNQEFYLYKIYKENTGKDSDVKVVYDQILHVSSYGQSFNIDDYRITICSAKIIDKIVVKSFDENNENIYTDVLVACEDEIVGSNFISSDQKIQYRYIESHLYTIEVYYNEQLICSYTTYNTLSISYFMIDVSTYKLTTIDFEVGAAYGV